jgi:hypothetical protein
MKRRAKKQTISPPQPTTNNVTRIDERKPKGFVPIPRLAAAL